IPFAREYPLGYIYQRATRRSPRKAENNEERRPRVPTEDRQSPQAGPRSTRRRHRSGGERRLMPRRRHAAVGRVDGARSRRLPHRVHGHEELPRRPRGGRDGRRSAHRRRAREALPHPHPKQPGPPLINAPSKERNEGRSVNRKDWGKTPRGGSGQTNRPGRRRGARGPVGRRTQEAPSQKGGFFKRLFGRDA